MMPMRTTVFGTAGALAAGAMLSVLAALQVGVLPRISGLNSVDESIPRAAGERVAALAVAAESDAPWPAELTSFRNVTPRPVFTAAEAPAWDVKIRERGWILKDGDQWRLWYTGYDGTREGRRKLGLATSIDGVNWTRHGPTGLIHGQEWVEDVCVVPDNGTLHMFAEGELDRAQRLTSTDGVNWKRQGRLDVRMVNGTPLSDGPYGTPAAWKEDGEWRLMYERRDLGVWLAKSKDLAVWTNVSDEPVIRPGPDAYDRDLIAVNQVIRLGDWYYASLHGAANRESERLWCVYLARSRDLTTWEKYPGNPLRPVDENRSSGVFVPVKDGYRLYTMHGRVDLLSHEK